jgi:hypothetical protein
MFDLALELLKFIGIGVSGIFGIVGLLTEFRDKHSGKVTFWGRLSLIGIVASTLVAALSQALEVRKDRQEAHDLSVRTARELHEIARAVTPLSSVSFWYRFDVDPNEPEFAAYERRAEAIINAYLANPKDAGMRQLRLVVAGGRLIPGTRRMVASTVIIPRDSPVYPNVGRNEILASGVVESPNFALGIFRTPRNFVATAFSGYSLKSVFDLAVRVSVMDPSTIQLGYDVAAKRFFLTGSQSDKNGQVWTNNGSVGSTLDFAGSQLIVHFDSNSSDVATSPYRLRTLIIDFGKGQRITLRGESMTAHLESASYEEILPTDPEKLFE